MSLFKNQNNDFEKKLKHQLDETGFKPSESLWGNIDQEINRPAFEAKVNGKIGDYKLNPNKETWTKIEAQFPIAPEGKNNKKYFWISLSVILFIGLGGIGYFINRLTNPLNEVKPILNRSELITESKINTASSTKNIEVWVNKIGVLTETIENYSVSKKLKQVHNLVNVSKNNKSSDNKLQKQI
jgi:hypothetical protein